MASFDFLKQYVLDDERVLLSPLNKDDIRHLLPFAINEPGLWTYSLQSGAGAENMKQYVANALQERVKGWSYPFLVWDKKTNQCAGSTRFYDIQLLKSSTQLGYTWYGKAFQGTGINAHCKYLLLRFAFETMGWERVEFRADNNNQRSIAAMKGIGCTVEGILRQDAPLATGGRRDSIVLSILKSEWEGHVKQRLLDKMKRVPGVAA